MNTRRCEKLFLLKQPKVFRLQQRRKAGRWMWTNRVITPFQAKRMCSWMGDLSPILFHKGSGQINKVFHWKVMNIIFDRLILKWLVPVILSSPTGRSYLCKSETGTGWCPLTSPRFNRGGQIASPPPPPFNVFHLCSRLVDLEEQPEGR